MPALHPLWRTTLLWAGIAVSIDVVLFAVLIAIEHLSGAHIRPAIGAWVMLHSPALSMATALLPGLPSAHGALPLISYVGFGVLALTQSAVLGGALGFLYATVRARENAL